MVAASPGHLLFCHKCFDSGPGRPGLTFFTVLLHGDRRSLFKSRPNHGGTLRDPENAPNSATYRRSGKTPSIDVNQSNICGCDGSIRYRRGDYGRGTRSHGNGLLECHSRRLAIGITLKAATDSAHTTSTRERGPCRIGPNQFFMKAIVPIPTRSASEVLSGLAEPVVHEVDRSHTNPKR